MKKAQHLIIILLCIGFNSILTGAGSSSGVTIETILNLHYVNQPVFDPSGEYIAYSLSVPRGADEEPGGYHREIWVATTTGELTQYTRKAHYSSAPGWTPDGKNITFTSKRKDFDDHKQIYSIPLDGGEAHPLFIHQGGISSYKWSPDGNYIAFMARDPKTKEEKAAKKAGKDWIDFNEDRKYTRLWVYNYNTGAVKQVFKQDLNVWSFAWAPDSKMLLFQGSPRPETDESYMFKQIYRVAASGGNPRQICETEGKLGSMSVSPDGETLAFLGAVSMNDPLAQSLFTVPVKGGNPVNLTENVEESYDDCVWQDNEHVILFKTNSTKTGLDLLNVSDGLRETLLKTDIIIDSFITNTANQNIAFTGNTSKHPSELFLLKANEENPVKLTNHNAFLKDIEFAKQETIHWLAYDSIDIAGVLTYPLGYREGRAYPLLLQIHGGPEGVSLDGWTTGTSTPVQLLAAEGYMVLEPNYRGSGGRGVAFSKADHDDLGGLEFDDVLAGVDYLIDKGFVDPDRVGTGGWSYGGYFSAWAATKHSQRFKAAMVGAGIANWISFMGTTDIPYEMSLVHWNSWWFDEPALHWERSPLAHINNAQTPTLVVHGDSDDRVHPAQGFELYQALRIKDVPTRYIIYPRQPHGLSDRAHREDYLNRILDWYNNYVK
jgi:dipeptidyl aminopeptidase/acylaminoacyl peptidase